MTYNRRIKAIEKRRGVKYIPDASVIALLAEYVPGRITEEEFHDRLAVIPESQHPQKKEIEAMLYKDNTFTAAELGS